MGIGKHYLIFPWMDKALWRDEIFVSYRYYSAEDGQESAPTS